MPATSSSWPADPNHDVLVVHPLASAHWIRHTTLTWVERNFGSAIAHAYAGHFDEGDTKNAIMTYVKAAVHDVATALSALTGEPHPLVA